MSLPAEPEVGERKPKLFDPEVSEKKTKLVESELSELNPKLVFREMKHAQKVSKPSVTVESDK